MNREFNISLVIDRHRRQLTECVLAVEHPAVGAGQERMGDIADALVDRRPRFRGGPRPLNSLTGGIGWNLTSGKPSRARVGPREGPPGHPAPRVRKGPAVAILPRPPPA